MKSGGTLTPAVGDMVMTSSEEEFLWADGKWNKLGLASNYAVQNHWHGYIENNGILSTTATAANGDRVAIIDNSDSKKITGGPAFGTATTTYLRNDGSWATPTNTTYSAATQSVQGLMSAADKIKLDGIATSANYYLLPKASSTVLGGVTVGSNISVNDGVISLAKADVTNALGYTPPTTNTTYTFGNADATLAWNTTVAIGYAGSTTYTAKLPANPNWTTHLYAGTTGSNTKHTTATNDEVTLNITDNSTVRNTIKIKGTGATTVTSDGSGIITIDSTDNNTTYDIANTTTAGLVKPWAYHSMASTGPTETSNATAVAVNALSATAGKYYAIEEDVDGRMFVNVPWSNTTYTFGNAGATLEWGSSVAIGHAGSTTYTVALPDNPNSQTKLIAGLNNSTANATATNGNMYLRLFDDTIARSSIKISGSGATTVVSDASGNVTVNSTNTTYTFANGTNGFTVTPSGGSAQTVTVIPSITNNITGSGTNGYIAKFNGTNTITNGPAFGTATTTFLNNKGEWTTPANNRDPGYGKITVGTASNAVTAIVKNTATCEASTYNETITFNPGNKWIELAGVNSGTENGDSFTIGHSLSGATSGTYGQASTTTTFSYSSNTLAIPNITIDPAGHITNISNVSVTLGAVQDVETTAIDTTDTTTKYYILGQTDNSTIITRANSGAAYVNGVYFTGNGVLQGAAWNDYAEYRKTLVEIEPGRVIKENGDGALSLTTQRLERGCEIISDTYGMIIGQTNDYNAPVAISGRVLAYPYEPIEEFNKHIGWPVCSGPDGTVSIMTEEEEMKYPSRIIGTISEIPAYKEWGVGNVKVNNRVWIRIR